MVLLLLLHASIKELFHENAICNLKNPRGEGKDVECERRNLSVKSSGKDGKWKDHGEIKGVMVARYRMPDCQGKRSSKRAAAKLRKNCDAHTYKRRPVNSMDRLPSRCARFQSVCLPSSLSPPPSHPPTKRYVVHTRRMYYVCMSQWACTCASTGTEDFCAEANETSKQRNWDRAPV